MKKQKVFKTTLRGLFYAKEITEEQFHLADKGGLTKDDEMEIFGMAVVWGYGLYGYEIDEEDGKYYAEGRQGDSCD